MFVSGIFFVPLSLAELAFYMSFFLVNKWLRAIASNSPLKPSPSLILSAERPEPPQQQNPLPLIQLPREFHTFAGPFTVLILVQPNLQWMREAVKKGSSSWRQQLNDN